MAEDVKKKNAEEKAAREKLQSEQRARATGKPTPTQEEMDAHSAGASILEHEADGSAPEVQVTATAEEVAKVQNVQRERAVGKPTPTQKEIDTHQTGATPVKLEPDGSAVEGEVAKELEAHKPTGGYQTRTMAPARRPATPAASE